MISEHTLEVSIGSNNVLFHGCHFGLQAEELILQDIARLQLLHSGLIRLPILPLSRMRTRFPSLLLRGRSGTARFDLDCVQLRERVID
jgi:hypothetical protein